MPSTPEFKTIKPITFLFHRMETNVSELISQVHYSQKLYKEAIDNKLDISGPVHWHYLNFEGEHKPFTLEISLPVGGVIPDYDGPYHFKRTEEFNCACLTHEGKWNDIPKTYDKLIEFIATKNRKPETTAREIYVQADINNQEANITEIQLGVQ
jgi:effector-binding domain-containing protein